MYCPKCEADVTTVVREVQETYPVKGEDIIIVAKVRFCKDCGEDIWDNELDSQNLLSAYAAYRKKHGLLQPSEIRAIREKYGLSQVAFARVLGLGDKTITRYENGSIADMAQNNLILLVQYPSNFKKLLEMNKKKISDTDYKTACAALESLCCSVVYKEAQVYSFYNNINMPFDTNRPKYWGDPIYA